MSSNDRYDFVFLEEAFGQLASKEIRASSDIVVLYNILTKSSFVVYWIRPDQITE